MDSYTSLRCAEPISRHSRVSRAIIHSHCGYEAGAFLRVAFGLTARSPPLALQSALANRRLIRITVFYGPAALGAKGLVAANLPMVVASTL